MKLMWKIVIISMICPLDNAFKGKVTSWLREENITNISCQDDVDKTGQILEKDGTVNMLCDNYEGISVEDTFWGRDDRETCQTNKGSKLTHKEMCGVGKLRQDRTTKTIELHCGGKQICKIPLYFFDDEICPHVRKYLLIVFSCSHLSGMKRAAIIAQKAMFRSDEKL